jgi:internalin A
MVPMNDTPTTPRRPRKRLRLTLGVMMLLVLVIGGGLGWIAYTARVQREAVAAILKQPRASVRYHWENPPGTKGPAAKPPGPKWLRDALGADVFDTVVDVNLSSPVNEEQVLHDVGKLVDLERLYFIGSDKPLSTSAIAEIRPLLRLRRLTVTHVANVDDFFPYLRDKTRLERLQLEGSQPTDADMANLAGLTKLELLYVGGKNVTDRGFAHLSGMTKLKRLTMREARLTTLEPLRAMRLLENLHMTCAEPTKGGPRVTSLEPLRDKPKLEWIYLEASTIDDRGLEGIETLVSLGLLDIGGGGLTAMGMRQLAKLPNFYALMLRGPGVTDEAIAGITSAPKLNALWLFDTQVSDLRTLEPVLGNLIILSISNAPLLVESLSALSGAKKLRTLGLAGCPVGDSELAKLPSWPTLTNLILDDTLVTDAGLLHLSRMPKLSVLSLSRTNVTDEGMANLARLSGLDSLNLTRTPITDAAIPHLKKLASCKRLGLSGTKITPEGERALKKALPGLQITKDNSAPTN